MADRSIVFINRLDRTMDPGDLSRSRFLIIDDHEKALLLRRELLSRGAAEIDRAELFGAEGKDFRDRYVDFLGRLNVENASFDWWPFNFTSKNYFVNDLCRQVFYTSLIVRLAQQSAGNLIVVTDDSDLAEYLERLLRSKGETAFNRIRAAGTILDSLRRFTPLGILYCLAAKFRTAVVSRRILRGRPVGGDPDCLIVTLLNRQSFDAAGSYRDTYFGPLRSHLQQEGVTFLSAGAVFDHDSDTVRPLHRGNDSSIVPLDAFTPIGELARWALRSLALYFSLPRIKGRTVFDGIDVRQLVLRCMKREAGSGNYLLNVWFYLSVAALANRIRPRTVLYPFENRSWEKMLVLALRKHAPDSRLIGYQHAAVTPRHSSLLFSEGEWDSTPVPDEVVTTGEVPAAILRTAGRYPRNRVHAGVALRQPPGRGTLREGKTDLRRILVILSSSVEEYVKSLLVLNEGLRGNTRYEIVIRSHPTIPLSSALELVPALSFDYRASAKASAAEDLQEADVVFYTSSTVALEAAAMGIPLVYLDLGDFMDPDPLFDFTDLKWSVRRPDDLLPTLERINAFPPAELQKRRHSARTYAVSYIRPADAAGIKEFLDFVLARKPVADEFPHRVVS